MFAKRLVKEHDQKDVLERPIKETYKKDLTKRYIKKETQQKDYIKKTLKETYANAKRLVKKNDQKNLSQRPIKYIYVYIYIYISTKETFNGD